MRTDVVGTGNQAHLWLRMMDRPITSGDWRVYEILAEVPDKAKIIDYDLALVGSGRSWLDAVSIGVADAGR